MEEDRARPDPIQARLMMPRILMMDSRNDDQSEYH